MTQGAPSRWGWGAAFAIAIAAALTYGFWPPAVDVDLGRVVRGPLEVAVEDDGKTRVRERYVVASPLAGRLVRTPLRSGDAVVANQTIVATIEASDANLLDDRSREEAEARLKATEAHHEQTAALIDRGRDAVEIALKELNRAETLFGKNVIPEETYDAARLKYRLASHDLRVAEFNQTIAAFERDQAKAALTRFSERPGTQESLYRHEMRSPISGLVFRVFEESATPVAVGTRLVELGDLHDLEVEIDILSVDAVQIHPGTKVRLNHWGGEEPLEARVRLVEPSAFTKVSALGIEEQRVWVIADILTPPEERSTLGDGFRVEAEIVVWEAGNVLKAPAGAFFRMGNQWAVFVYRDGYAELRQVKLGRTNGLETVVLEGLTAGDKIVLHPSDRVRDGVRLTPRENIGTTPVTVTRRDPQSSDGAPSLQRIVVSRK